MSKIDDLIARYCPNGVEYKLLGDLEDKGFIKLGRGNVISKTDLRDNPGDYPVYSSSATGNGALGYYSKYMFDDERLSWSIDGGGRFFYRPKHKYSITNVCGWLKVLNEEKLSTKYLFYVLTNEWVKKVFDYTKKAHPSVIRKEYTIPIPPLAVQEEIVNILDSFTLLEAKLVAELVARKQQYEHYRDELLNIANKPNVQIMTLSEICSFRRGSFPQPYGEAKWYGGDGGKPFVQVVDVSTDLRLVSDTKNKISVLAQPMSVFVPKGTVIVSLQGSIGRVAITQYDSYVDRTLAIFSDYKIDILKKYFAYQIQRLFGIKKEIARGSTIKTITKEEFSKFTIPVPPLAEQERIVSILDKFDALVNDISDGLPAEINARRQQYEYYRNKLLNFEPMAA